ncbi:AAA family ATPase [Tenacibaculum sp. M341]|uniref:AAA family ATPase n=1 Tax=Tenacibaculum sp. M341 TaxID=2530339 RepID=UPI0010466AD2|nr:AAA family ATPase [Tenacibaculum sp. M341]TCI95080.1 AAA family ATPase [Tenacibaculum sp. M341]
MKNNIEEKINNLHEVLNHIKNTFIGKDHIIDLLGICLVAQENLFLYGPPGTAKSAIVKELSKTLKGKTFEYLLTKFTEPNELYGPFDIRKLKEGDLITNTEGMLPEATLIFLDELFNANSAILNSLLMVLNEKVFKRGKETKKIPALISVGASNNLPEDEALQALFDRFLIRVKCDNVAPDLLANVLNAGWKLQQKVVKEIPTIEVSTILDLQQEMLSVDLSPITNQYIEMVSRLRNAGISVSDRRAVKLQRLVAASALLCKRDKAILSDLWIFKYTWENNEQREVLNNIVESIIKEDTEENQHPRALENNIPDPEEIYKDATELLNKWKSNNITSADRATIKDKLRNLTGRCDWISNTEKREFVLTPINELWELILNKKEITS